MKFMNEKVERFFDWINDGSIAATGVVFGMMILLITASSFLN